jgi:PTH2 family peptidyl-tRNA hydrolase
MKLVVVVRTDIELSRGKLAVQVAHASVAAALRCPERDLQRWLREGQRKVVLKVDTLEELRELARKAAAVGLATELVVDAGLTELPPNTVTCLAIGPAEDALLDRVTGTLGLL